MTTPAEITSPLKDAFPESTTAVAVGDSVVAQSFGDTEAEYGAIRGTTAKIDLSGAGLVEVSGADAFDLLQQALARDLEFVTPEQSLISMILDAEGKGLDVVTAYHAEEGYRLETSIGQGTATAAHLTALRDETGLDAEITQVNDRLTILLIEGPKAAVTLEDTIEPDLGALPLSGLMEVDFNGVDLLVSRSGFTGEYGYKIFVPAADARTVWDALETVVPAGVGALEAAMLEVRQPVLHREDRGTGALENGYAWLIDITKESFHGRDAVLAAFEDGGHSLVVGFAAPGAESAPEGGTPVTIGGTEIGKVVYADYSPGRKEFIGLAKVRGDLVAPNLDVKVGDLEATTIAAPYYLPESWKSR